MDVVDHYVVCGGIQDTGELPGDDKGAGWWSDFILLLIELDRDAVTRQQTGSEQAGDGSTHDGHRLRWVLLPTLLTQWRHGV
jgi:hypothetical protein